MALQHGRGKESFRSYTKALNQVKRDILSAVKSGETYTAAEISHFYAQITREYELLLPDLGVDVELWGDRAIDKQVEIYSTTLDILQIAEIRQSEEVQSETEIEDSQQEQTKQNDETLFGISTLTKENKAYVRSKGKPRKRILSSLEELEEYVSEVPYILAIQVLVGSDERVLGYRVWVEASKDRKRKKNAS